MGARDTSASTSSPSSPGKGAFYVPDYDALLTQYLELPEGQRPALPPETQRLPEPERLPIGKPGDPSPDGSEEALQVAIRADAEARAGQDVPLEQDPEYIAWRRRVFGDSPENHEP